MSNSFISDIENELRKAIKGEVRFREVDRILYSSDASNYQIKPVGVVIPKTQEDLLLTINIARKSNMSIIPRGGGSGLAGQALGNGLVVDFSKYFNKVKIVDIESKSVLVQPGVNLQTLNNYLDQFGLMFGPDPSSANVATIGGVISNNATGAHSILYGMSGDHVNDANVIMSDGSNFMLNESQDENNIFFRKLDEFISKNKKLIVDKFPRHWRRASGYSLNYLLDNNLNPAKLLASSEGTLALATEFNLNLVEKPKIKGLCLLQFNNLVESLVCIPDILSKNPSAIELMDGLLLELTRSNKSFSKPLSLFKDNTKAALIVEFYGDNLKDVGKKTTDFSNYIKTKKITQDISILIETEEQESIWNLRKAGLGLLMSRRSDFKPIPCIEDVSVPVENLSDYTADLTKIMDEMKLSAGYYGHASAGCIHIRPLVNLSDKTGVSQMCELMDASLNYYLEMKYMV